MDTLNFCEFEASARAVMAFLRERLGFDLWMVTRVEGDEGLVLLADDRGYGIAPGTPFQWSDSYCAQMVRGNGPHIAPDVTQVPAYAAAALGCSLVIGAYLGVPLLRADGSVFGTLCAIDPRPQPEAILAELPLLAQLGEMLSTTLQLELRIAEEARRAERFQAEALTDAMTHLYNRGGWTQLLEAEEARCRRYGHAAAVLVIDLDELKRVNDSQGHAAGDALIVRTALALRLAVREVDIVARLGGDEFGIICVGCNRAGGETLRRRIEAELDSAGIRASIGLAQREAGRGLQDAWDRADRLMYQHKHLRLIATR
ncbi:sensor domain-containing diguanylate cyclase [Pseudomonas sp. GCM10022188]|uniref:sensor domain-containing diguanylate cyclase n=1 Tax=Pseudomonas TaxID=286 RepID=UPI001E4C1817|nr:sensor domain-containing diguanylate cyclase [Pseudomonas oryzagri]MCC6074580.1 sensor domain-containing diguanylate cyclase [Pseudomonas oryzagri]